MRILCVSGPSLTKMGPKQEDMLTRIKPRPRKIIHFPICLINLYRLVKKELSNKRIYKLTE